MVDKDTLEKARFAKALKIWDLAHADPEEEMPDSNWSAEALDLDDEDEIGEDELTDILLTESLLGALNEPSESVQQRKRETVTVIRKDSTAILCEGGHLKMASWQWTGPGGRKWRTPHLYPAANWRILEPAARRWLFRLGITLSEGECVLCPPHLTLGEMLG